MNLLTFSVRNGRSPPERSSSMKVTPPEVPTPGMAGGEKEKAMPSGTLASSGEMWLRMAVVLLLGLRCARPRVFR